jgi:hypothetical protein
MANGNRTEVMMKESDHEERDTVQDALLAWLKQTFGAEHIHTCPNGSIEEITVDSIPDASTEFHHQFRRLLQSHKGHIQQEGDGATIWYLMASVRGDPLWILINVTHRKDAGTLRISCTTPSQFPESLGNPVH